MHDAWTDRLSEYIDGELDAAETAALEQHLKECDACAAIVVELRAVVGSATLAGGIEPERDLWQGIAARIGAQPAVIPIRRSPRRFSFSAPQLAAAAVVLMALSGGAVYLLQQDATPQVAAGTIVQTAGGAGPVRDVSTAAPEPDPQVAADVDELERVLAENRDRLDPATVEIVERSIESIDLAIEAATSALDADPGNPYLHRQLDNTMRKKLDLLRRVTRERAGA